MTTIFLIRHAENDMLRKGRLACRLPGVHLNKEGHLNAQLLADNLAPKLKTAQIKGIFSSPMERAIETAQPLANALELPIIIRDGLLETNCGEWAGKTLKSLSRRKLWKIVQQTPSQFCFPGGESFIDVQQRIVQALNSLCAEFPDPKDVLLCFSHADPIKLAVTHYLNMALDDFQRLILMPASITALRFSTKKTMLLTFNQQVQKDLPI